MVVTSLPHRNEIVDIFLHLSPHVDGKEGGNHFCKVHVEHAAGGVEPRLLPRVAVDGQDEQQT